eukprot:2214894-Ditylum_brightwellii.AAC.1
MNLHYGSERQTVKEWVVHVQELNRYLKDFSDHNRNPTQPLDEDKLLDILEFGVLASWRREFTVQGFDPVDQGLCKFVEFCSCLESYEPSEEGPKVEKTEKARGRKRKAEVLTTPTITTTTTPRVKFYCKMHGPNRTHNRKDCFELKRHTRCTKADANRGRADKVSYKDLNAFVNTKVTAALNKAKKKKQEAKKVTINAFDNFCNLKVDNSSNEVSDHKVNTLAAASDDDSDSNASHVPSKDSNSNDK